MKQRRNALSFFLRLGLLLLLAATLFIAAGLMTLANLTLPALIILSIGCAGCSWFLLHLRHLIIDNWFKEKPLFLTKKRPQETHMQSSIDRTLAAELASSAIDSAVKRVIPEKPLSTWAQLSRKFSSTMSALGSEAHRLLCGSDDEKQVEQPITREQFNKMKELLRAMDSINAMFEEKISIYEHIAEISARVDQVSLVILKRLNLDGPERFNQHGLEQSTEVRKAPAREFASLKSDQLMRDYYFLHDNYPRCKKESRRDLDYMLQCEKDIREHHVQTRQISHEYAGYLEQRLKVVQDLLDFLPTEQPASLNRSL